VRLPQNRKIGKFARVKTTIEIPDPLFRRVKSKAAERSQSLKEFVAEALREKLATAAMGANDGRPPWMAGFGQLRRLRKETERINARVEEAFEAIEPEDRA
jgi:hypothetical protein